MMNCLYTYIEVKLHFRPEDNEVNKIELRRK